jgi:hypothetical protein
MTSQRSGNGAVARRALLEQAWTSTLSPTRYDRPRTWLHLTTRVPAATVAHLLCADWGEDAASDPGGDPQIDSGSLLAAHCETAVASSEMPVRQWMQGWPVGVPMVGRCWSTCQDASADSAKVFP